MTCLIKDKESNQCEVQQCTFQILWWLYSNSNSTSKIVVFSSLNETGIPGDGGMFWLTSFLL